MLNEFFFASCFVCATIINEFPVISCIFFLRTRTACCKHEAALLNVKHHRTTPKPAIHTSITAEKDEAGQNIVYSTKTYTGGAAAAAVLVYTYVCIQARPISTNPRSMGEECEYGLPGGTCFSARRLEVVAVAGLLWIYFVVCFFSVWWDFASFFFSFSLL